MDDVCNEARGYGQRPEVATDNPRLGVSAVSRLECSKSVQSTDLIPGLAESPQIDLSSCLRVDRIHIQVNTQRISSHHSSLSPNSPTGRVHAFFTE